MMSDQSHLPWIIVGYGRVGQAIALLGERLAVEVRATWNRTQAAANRAAVPSPAPHYGPLPKALKEHLKEPVLLWVTIVDDAIESTFSSLGQSLCEGSIAVHTSGSLASTIFDGPPTVATASLHPLQAISTPRAAVERFDRSFWTIEGDDAAVNYLNPLLAPAGIEPVRIDPPQKVLYHAAAATAANLLVSLLDAAIAMARAADIEAVTARRMLVELGRSSLENLVAQPPQRALTGPSSRGDLAVIERHRRALAELDDATLVEIYDLLTQRALHGLSDD